MDTYYYDIFTFDNWPAAIIAIGIAGMILLGSKQYSEISVENERRIKRYFNDRLYFITSVVFTAMFGVSFTLKSWREFFWPMKDAPEFLGWIVLPVIIAAFGIFIYRVGKISGLIKLGSLVEKRRKVVRLAKEYNGALYDDEGEE